LSDGTSGTEPAGKYTFLYGKGNEKHELGSGFFVHKRIISAFKNVECVGYRMSYIILRGLYCVLNINAPAGDKIGDVGDNFYGELECAFDKFPSMDILLGVFSAEVGREAVFKLTIRNES
jgi:hypothetical protein